MTFNEPTKSDKIVPIVCGIILVAFFAYLPSMVAEENARLEQEWRDKGCQMYDDDKLANIPAKCANAFTDHYKPQELRSQP